MSNQEAYSAEGEPESGKPNAYFDEVSGLRERYDSHILPADYKYKVGMSIFDVFKLKFCKACVFCCCTLY